MAYELIKSTTTGSGFFYAGQAEQAIIDITYPPEQLPGMEWLAEKVNNAFIAAAGDEGTVLQSKVYFVPASWYDCKYRVVVTAHASPLAWTAIILTALIVVGIGFIAWILRSVTEMPWLGVGLIAVGVGVGAIGIGYLVKSTRQS